MASSLSLLSPTPPFSATPNPSTSTPKLELKKKVESEMWFSAEDLIEEEDEELIDLIPFWVDEFISSIDPFQMAETEEEAFDRFFNDLIDEWLDNEDDDHPSL